MSNTERALAKFADRIAEQQRKDEAAGRRVRRRIQEARALSPVAADKPELARAPLRDLWPARRALLIINSKSGPDRDSLSQVRDLVDTLGGFGFRVDVRVKLRKAQARKQARAAARKRRYDVVIAAGGDGTVESVASGLLGTTTPLGIIPLGTYNNVAASLGVPQDVRQACALIACGSPRQIDAGLVMARYMKRPRAFLEVSTVGLGAALGTLGQHLEKGRWEHASRALPQVVGMPPRPTRIILDGEARDMSSNTLLVTISNSPRAGAGLDLAPGAHMDDGLLDVRVYENLDQTGVVRLFLPTTPEAERRRIPHAVARTVEVEAAEPMPVSIESKLVGTTPARFTIAPGALWVIPGDGSALLRPASSTVVAASELAAQAIATPADETTPAIEPEAGLGTRSLQILVPTAGRTFEAVSAARSIAVPILTGALGLAAATLLRATAKRRRG